MLIYVPISVAWCTEQRREWEKVHRVIHSHQLTVIEPDTTFLADVFSHSGGCHTIPPFSPHISAGISLLKHLFLSSSRKRPTLCVWPRLPSRTRDTRATEKIEVWPSGPTIISPSHTTGYQLVNAPSQSDVVILPPGNCCEYYTTSERLPETPKVPNHYTIRE